MSTIKKFEFSSSSAPQTTFTGFAFYSIYKEAEFLRHSDNIEQILSKGYQLRHSLKEVKPGTSIMLGNMNLEKNTPLLIKKTGANVVVEDFEFTANRLTGLTAAYAYENYHRFPAINASEAIALGLTWDNTSKPRCKLYLSAVTGTEHFYSQFSYWPLVCALRKLQLKKITPEIVVKMAKIKNNVGERLAQELMKNKNDVFKLWAKFPNSSKYDLNKLMITAPPEVKAVFK